MIDRTVRFIDVYVWVVRFLLPQAIRFGLKPIIAFLAVEQIVPSCSDTCGWLYLGGVSIIQRFILVIRLLLYVDLRFLEDGYQR